MRSQVVLLDGFSAAGKVDEVRVVEDKGGPIEHVGHDPEQAPEPPGLSSRRDDKDAENGADVGGDLQRKFSIAGEISHRSHTDEHDSLQEHRQADRDGGKSAWVYLAACKRHAQLEEILAVGLEAFGGCLQKEVGTKLSLNVRGCTYYCNNGESPKIRSV